MGGHVPQGAGDRGAPERPPRGGRLIARVVYLVPAALHAGLIFFLSSRPFPHVALGFHNADKVAHMTIFAVLAVLTAWGIRRAFPAWSTGRSLLLALVLSVAYGAVDELHQRFVPTRTPDVKDLAADGVGAGVAVAGVAWWRRRKQQETAL